ncbi:lipocalin family protein [Chryseobacterium sp.]|uniref:lipocalin family protein n=1 Tax=Chryseobacterium sp. TaxID=1871047 RepID=UPI00333EA4CB
MKKLLTGILAAGIISSCSTGDDSLPVNDNPDNNTATNIIGIWKIQTEYSVSGADKTTVIKEYAPDDCKKKSTYEFRNDGQYYLIDYNSVNSGCQKVETTLSYTYSPASMELTIGNNTGKVLELSSNKLTLLTPDNEDNNGDGINDYTKYLLYR